jgi:hypothetical protein
LLEKAMCRGSSCIHIAGVTIGYFDFDWKWYEMVSSSVWNYLQYPFLFVFFFLVKQATLVRVLHCSGKLVPKKSAMPNSSLDVWN